MNKFLLFPLVFIVGTLIFYWSSRSNALEKAATSVSVNPVPVETKAEVPAPKVKLLTMEEARDKVLGYWMAKSPVGKNNDQILYQVNFSKVSNPELKGHLFEGIIYSYNPKEPFRQTVGNIIPVSIHGELLKLKIEEKDISVFYSNGAVYQEKTDQEFFLNLATMRMEIRREHYDTLGTTLEKGDLSVINPFLKKWKGSRKSDKQRLEFNLTGINNIDEDFGTIRASGECSGTTKVKIRPISSTMVLITSGNGYCDTGDSVYRVVMEEGGSSRAIIHKMYQEPQELALNN